MSSRPKCQNKHALRECPLDSKFIETSVIFVDNHDTKECPPIPGFKVVYPEEVIPNQVDPPVLLLRDHGKNHNQM